MAITANFTAGTGNLTVVGDGLANSIVISRDAGGFIMVNGGTVPVSGGTPTVANCDQAAIDRKSPGCADDLRVFFL